jgi:thymidylate synthase
MKIIKDSININELKEMAREEFGDVIKAVVDIMQGIMAVGGELHADEEVLLMEEAGSKRQDTWGINLYLEKSGEDFIEFDSMINLKPHYGNRSRGVEDSEVRDKIKKIVEKLVLK